MKAMILAAGRGERMRPLTDTRPKPLLEVGGKPLIVWQIEALVRAGIVDIVVNHAWLGQQIEAALGDGDRYGARIRYSPETSALETAGGIAQALPLLCNEPDNPAGERFIVVSGDILTGYDYRRLMPRATELAESREPGMFLVMVPNPPFHPEGDFALHPDGRLAFEGERRLTFGNLGLYDSRSFSGILPGTVMPIRPLYHAAIAAGSARGELFEGIWENIGTPAQLAEINQRHEKLCPKP